MLQIFPWFAIELFDFDPEFLGLWRFLSLGRKIFSLRVSFFAFSLSWFSFSLLII